jgi:uroporphyrinogen III methyltransferase/synthase
VTFITGHEAPGKEESDIAWDKLATGTGTIVFLMGVGNLTQVAESLIMHGRSPDNPVAVIYKGTLPEQRTLVGKLEDIARLATENNIKPPAVIVVGDVVHLRDELNWFEKRPLFGKRIIVTRAREQASGFLKGLTVLGAECIEFPTIKVVPPENWDALDQAIESLDGYQWLLFTSVNGVKYFLERLNVLGKDVRDLKGLRIGAIGPKTAETWHHLGIKPDLVPDEYRAEAVVECFKEQGIKGARILLPRAIRAREVLPQELRKLGAEVEVVPAYQTIMPDHDTGQIREMLEQGSIDMVTFTSSSTVTNFVEMFKDEGERFKVWMARAPVACIGPITAKTAKENGLSVDLVPSEYTIEAFTDSIVQYFASKLSEGG